MAPAARAVLHASGKAAAAFRNPRANAGAPEAAAPRRLGSLQQRQTQQLCRGRPLPSPTMVFASSSPSPSPSSLRRPGGVSAAASSTQVDRDHTAASMDSSRGQALVAWLEANGAPQQKVELREVIREGRPLDVAVAAADLKSGERALEVPDELVVTLSRVFEDGALAELLTTNKLSELACLALFLMYEKKLGSESKWQPFIKELDRIQARGALGAKSPLLWTEEERARLLRGSPLLAEAEARVAAVEKEYEELDTVWFMAGSLFNRYPYDAPTSVFSLSLFKQAFAAVQASVVHLQGVPTSRRFALVPMGPPLLSYSSNCRALLKWEPSADGGPTSSSSSSSDSGSKGSVVLDVDRDVKKGDPVVAWCGPQPNRRLLLNYGIVDESNPSDAESVTITLPNDDPLFAAKRAALQRGSSATTAAFKLTAKEPLPAGLIPYLRLAFCEDAAFVAGADPLRAAAAAAGPAGAGGGEASASPPSPPPLGPEVEAAALGALTRHLRRRLAAYGTSIAEDDATVASEGAGPRQKVAARLLRIEKRILGAAQEKTEEAARASGVDVEAAAAAAAAGGRIAVRLS